MGADIQINWNTIFYKLDDLNYCIDETSPKPRNEVLNTMFDYKKINLTSLVKYEPLENYLSGNYHGRSSSFPNKYQFNLKATDLGILAENKPKHLTELQEELYNLHQDILITINVINKYNSNKKCGKTINKETNIYSNQEEEEILEDCKPSETMACINFELSEKLYDNTQLINMQVPQANLNRTEILQLLPENNKHTTFTCDLDNDIGDGTMSLEKIGTATPYSKKNREPCHTYLTFHTIHERDAGLVDYLSTEDIKNIRSRLLWTAFALIGGFFSFLLYGSFRGSRSYSYEVF